ncbi:MAG: TrgA family protein, partial [Roseivivax sp.]|nr:TrgA family protein [Roseivivax sp.]
TGKMSEVTAGLGLLTGWIVLGSRAGRGWTAGINNGITATVVLVFWALFVFGAYKMIIDALARRFRDPMEAFAEVFLKMYEYASYLADTNIILSLLIGAVVAGLLTEMAGRAWR